MRIVHRLVLALWLAGVAACGRGTTGDEGLRTAAQIPVPARAATAGDALLGLAPKGAEVVIELDMARLRENAVVGPLVQALTTADTPWRPALGVVRDASSLLFCAYGVGSSEAVTLTLLRGPAVQPLGRAIGPDTAALGPEALVRRAEAAAVGMEPAMESDRLLLLVRTRAMPERAPGASVRMAARLGFDARVGLASRIELEEVPVAVSVWGDVADDLAVVALLEAENPASAKRLGQGLERWRERLAAMPGLRPLGLDTLVRRIDITVQGSEVRAILLIGPARLQRLVGRLVRVLPQAQPNGL